ncbi:MAG: ATP-binding protein, partial [Anaerolineae bacterium]|nr:ATP-binding protein [Anaerolineae bacterium]
HKMTAEELNDLLSRRVPEDLFLDYKSAMELSDRKEASKTIRQYLSGFANSAGGILIIGVDENTWCVTPCESIIRDDLAKWAARCLTEIAHYFSPPPRFQVLKHPDGYVLIAVTDRSLGLVPCRERGELIYYIRFHDQMLDNKTLKVPEYLMADLVLGRRQRPQLHIKQLTLLLTVSEKQQSNSRLLKFGMNFTIENESLSWANEVKLGVVRQILHPPMPLSNHLLSYVDVQENNKQFTGDHEYSINHSMVSNNPRLDSALDPFSILHFTIPGNVIPIRVLDKFYRYTWQAAVYVMSKETPPLWYQVQLEVNDKVLKMANDNQEIVWNGESEFLSLIRLTSERAIVGWTGFDEQAWR